MRSDQGIIDLSFPSSIETIWQVAVDNTCKPVMQDDLFLPYDKWFTTGELEKIQGIDIVHDYKCQPDNSIVFKKFSDLSGFSSLKFLSVPSDATQYIDINSVSNHLEALSLWVSRSGRVKNLDFFNCDFPLLKTIYFYYPFSCFNDFDISFIKNIEWLSIDLELDKKMISLSHVHLLKNLSGVKLSGVRNKDVLFLLNNNLIALDIWGSKVKEIDFSPLNNMSYLRFLKINSKLDFDCQNLINLKNIEQISLMNIQTLSNIEVLLQISSLKRLSMRFIKNKALTDSLKKRFKANLEFWED